MTNKSIVEQALTRKWISADDRDAVYGGGGRFAKILRDAISTQTVSVASSSSDGDDGDGFDWSNLPMINRRG